ncbi:hypothetical protein [Kitasatospora sp. NPDC057500]|uniref:hypothetical protein n=1 Tax=Kitasatospora sp. NPDC057500 TaxID=3346151 RepID=UPI00367A534C
MGRRTLVLAAAAIAWWAGTTVPTAADSHTRFYVYEDPQQPTRTRTVDVVTRISDPSQHKVGDCKNVWMGRDFYNETGHTVLLFRQPGATGDPDLQLLDGEEIVNTTGFQSVCVLNS